MLPVSSVYRPLVSSTVDLDALRQKNPVGPSVLPDSMRPAPTGAPAANGFSDMLDGLVRTVDTKQAEAGELTKRVLLGESDQLHQSVIAMQEASVAFTLMVEVRNKLVESYQELMRMQV
jgi:flagellar hook-basal body complex protein FliE